jgi:hypothetical protein
LPSSTLTVLSPRFDTTRSPRHDRKAIVSQVLYAAAIPLAFVEERISHAIYAAVALMWLVPDPRIERRHRGEQ